MEWGGGEGGGDHPIHQLSQLKSVQATDSCPTLMDTGCYTLAGGQCQGLLKHPTQLSQEIWMAFLEAEMMERKRGGGGDHQLIQVWTHGIHLRGQGLQVHSGGLHEHRLHVRPQAPKELLQLSNLRHGSCDVSDNRLQIAAGHLAC